MNGTIFKIWVKEQLISALPFDERKTVVIMDNAPYHFVKIDKPPAPTKSSKKVILQNYLAEKMSKLTLLAIKEQL